MALRSRNTNLMRGIGQENVAALKAKSTTSGVTTRRAALGDITTNTNSQLPVNKGLDLKKEVSKTALPKPISTNLRDVSNKIAKENAQSKIQKPSQKTLSTNPFTTYNRTLGLKKKDEVKLLEPVKKEKPLAVELPADSKEKEPEVEACDIDYCDIDKDDMGKPFLVPEYANDIYIYLRSLEAKYPVTENYLAGQYVTPRMRATLVDWLVEVQLQYHLLNETLHLCVAILDMFLQKVVTITRERLQLVGVGAMLVACKYEETYSPSVDNFVYITDNSFSKDEVLAMEKYICGTLKFQLGRPNSLHFLRRYSKAAFSTPLQHSIAKYLLELSLVEYKMVHVRPSLVAAAACYIALCVTDDTKSKQSLWTNTLVKYSTYNLSKLRPVVSTMTNMLLKISSSKFQAVPRKYANSRMHKVSCLPALESNTLKKIAELL